MADSSLCFFIKRQVINSVSFCKGTSLDFDPWRIALDDVNMQYLKYILQQDLVTKLWVSNSTHFTLFFRNTAFVNCIAFYMAQESREVEILHKVSTTFVGVNEQKCFMCPLKCTTPTGLGFQYIKSSGNDCLQVDKNMRIFLTKYETK